MTKRSEFQPKIRNSSIVLLSVIAMLTASFGDVLGFEEMEPGQQYIKTLPVSMLPVPMIDPEFAQFFPVNISGLVYFDAFIGVVQYDISVNEGLSEAFRKAMVDKSALVYMEPSNETSAIIFCDVYRLNNASIAQEVLDFYKKGWNKDVMMLHGREVWVWRQDQDPDTEGPFIKKGDGGIFTIDKKSVKIAFDKTQIHGYMVSTVKEDLYLRHGVAVIGDFLISMDVYAPKDRLDELSEDFFFSSMEPKKAYEPLPTSATPESETSTNETQMILGFFVMVVLASLGAVYLLRKR